MQVYRIDDIPLIYEQLRELRLSEIIDRSIKTSGSWQGISLGNLVCLWLCYLISESDHRLSPVESWASENLLLLQSLSGLPSLSSKDFTDDRLGLALDYLSDETNWHNFSHSFEGNSLSIYDLESLPTLRLDAAPMQGHHRIQEDGLFQKGHSKHHKNTGQFKVMLATLDNEVNSFSYPLYHKVFSGEKADDVLYRPVIEECEKVFKSIGALSPKLIVGDSKMGSQSLRSYIEQSGHFYLMPLSKIQLSQDKRIELIKQYLPLGLEPFYKKDKKGELVLVAEGFETSHQVNYIDKTTGSSHNWTERLLFVLSHNYAQSQQAAFEKKIKSAESQLLELVKPKQGKKGIKSKTELKQSINSILSEKDLEAFLKVDIKDIIEIKYKRKYKDRPAGIEEIVSYQLIIKRNQKAIEDKKQIMGWQVYACNGCKQKLSLEQCIWKYRAQNRIESRFDNLRNKIAPLIPIFLQKDNRIEALVNLLMIALKAISVMEYKAAKSLKEKNEALANIYHGNPKQKTKTPTAKKMLTAFKGISIVVFKDKNNIRVEMTTLNQTQMKIISLIGFKNSLYKKLIDKIRISLSQ